VLRVACSGARAGAQDVDGAAPSSARIIAGHVGVRLGAGETRPRKLPFQNLIAAEQLPSYATAFYAAQGAGPRLALAASEPPTLHPVQLGGRSAGGGSHPHVTAAPHGCC
jgi:hypothetical protein